MGWVGSSQKIMLLSGVALSCQMNIARFSAKRRFQECGKTASLNTLLFKVASFLQYYIYCYIVILVINRSIVVLDTVILTMSPSPSIYAGV